MKNVQSLWVGNHLSRMEQACINSFLNLGYEYNLYVYENIDNLPEKVKVFDANEIMPASELFVYNLPLNKGGGSYSGFSNYFRYKLLHLKGGTWVDTDVFLLKDLPCKQVLVINQDFQSVASCILRFPLGHEVPKICNKICVEKDKKKILWGETGPDLITAVTIDLKIKAESSAEYFPIGWQETHRFLHDEPIPDTYTVHFWNEMWRRNVMFKNKKHPQNTLYEKLLSLQMKMI